MKQKNGLVIGVLILAALCLAYVGIGQYMDGREEKEAKKAEAEIQYMTNFSDVTGIAFASDGVELSFTKKDGTWYYDKDPEFPVLQSKLESIAGAAGKLAAVRKLEGGDDFSAYGLDAPVQKVTVTADGGTEETVLLGGTTEEGDYYAALEGQDIPWLIDSSLYGSTSVTLDDLMALEEFPDIAGTDIRGITVTKDGQTKKFEKKILDGEEGTIAWYKDSAESEGNKLADNSALNVLADSISSLTPESCVNYKVQEAQLAGYGLEEPQTVIAWVYEKNGETQTFTLSVGALNDDETSYYTRSEGSKNVNAISKETIDKCLTVDEEAGEGEE